MSDFHIPINSIDRQNMSIMPPPAFDEDTWRNSLPSQQLVNYYGDMWLMKQRFVVRIMEMVDDEGTRDGRIRFRLYVVRMGNRHDLNVILRAAQHLQLISEPSVENVFADELSACYERSRMEVTYGMATEDAMLDETHNDVHQVFLPADERRRIWLNLFEAAGYRAEWGDVFNVRKESV